MNPLYLPDEIKLTPKQGGKTLDLKKKALLLQQKRQPKRTSGIYV